MINDWRSLNKEGAFLEECPIQGSESLNLPPFQLHVEVRPSLDNEPWQAAGDGVPLWGRKGDAVPPIAESAGEYEGDLGARTITCPKHGVEQAPLIPELEEKAPLIPECGLR